MSFALLFSLALSLSPAHAGVSRCAKVKAEAADLQATKPVACEESKETYETFVKGIPEAVRICEKLEAELAAGPVKLKLGTEDEMQMEAMDIKQRHLQERDELIERTMHELFPTVLDNNDLSRIPASVSSDCGTEIENLVRFRKNFQRGINEYYSKFETSDDSLFQQASERALPANTAPPVKTVR